MADPGWRTRHLGVPGLGPGPGLALASSILFLEKWDHRGAL